MIAELFILQLRKSIIEKRIYTLFEIDSPCTDILKATDISFTTSTTDKIGLSAASGYSNYDCRAVLFFYMNCLLDHPTYLQTCSALDKIQNKEMASVLFMDRRDLLDYLQGISTASLKIKGAVKDKQQLEAELFGFDLTLKRSLLTQEQRDDIGVIKRFAASTRTINTCENILCIKGTKNFAGIEKPAFQSFMGLAKKKNVIKPEKPKSKAEIQKLTLARMPILIIPAATQSLLTLYNVRQFLIDAKFVHSDDIRAQGEKKPTNVILERDPKKLSTNQTPKFLVIDAVDSLKPLDWDRVVAVFATGQEWQFRGWKWEVPVDIFMMGYSLKFQDDPSMGCLGDWKVDNLKINRSKRYLDSKVVHSFWQSLDKFLNLKNKKNV